MPALEWTPALQVGVGEMDKQHRQLVEMINNLQAAIRASNPELTNEVLDGLVKYTVTHFGTEERLMARHPYDGMDDHKRAHAQFIERVGKTQTDIKTKTVTASITLSGFLTDWLVSHIQKVDKNFAAHLKSKGVT